MQQDFQWHNRRVIHYHDRLVSCVSLCHVSLLHHSSSVHLLDLFHLDIRLISLRLMVVPSLFFPLAVPLNVRICSFHKWPEWIYMLTRYQKYYRITILWVKLVHTTVTVHKLCLLARCVYYYMPWENIFSLLLLIVVGIYVFKGEFVVAKKKFTV